MTLWAWPQVHHTHEMMHIICSLDMFWNHIPNPGSFITQCIEPKRRGIDIRLNKLEWSKQSWDWWFETPSRSLWRHCNEMSSLRLGCMKWHFSLSIRHLDFSKCDNFSVTRLYWRISSLKRHTYITTSQLHDPGRRCSEIIFPKSTSHINAWKILRNCTFEITNHICRENARLYSDKLEQRRVWWCSGCWRHHIDIIMSVMASQITGVSIGYSTVCSGEDQRKHQSSVSLAFVREFTGDRWLKMYEFRLQFHGRLFLRIQLTLFQHCFRYWLGAVQVTSHYLSQLWLVYARIYTSSLGLNELNYWEQTLIKCESK